MRFKNFEISSSKTPEFVFISSEVRIPNRNRCELSSENIFFCSNASRTNKNQRNPNSFGFWIFQSILTKVGDRLVDGWIMFMCWTIALQLWKHFNLCLVQIEFQFIPAFLCRLMCFVLFFFHSWSHENLKLKTVICRRKHITRVRAPCAHARFDNFTSMN